MKICNKDNETIILRIKRVQKLLKQAYEQQNLFKIKQGNYLLLNLKNQLYGHEN